MKERIAVEIDRGDAHIGKCGSCVMLDTEIGLKAWCDAFHDVVNGHRRLPECIRSVIECEPKGDK